MTSRDEIHAETIRLLEIAQNYISCSAANLGNSPSRNSRRSAANYRDVERSIEKHVAALKAIAPPPSHDPGREDEINRLRAEMRSDPTMLCGDCPPVGYPTDKTRCLPCPRRAPSADAGPSEAMQLAAFEEALTPSAETKAAYIGEVKMRSPRDGDGPITVTWVATKEIMKLIRARAALSAAAATDISRDAIKSAGGIAMKLAEATNALRDVKEAILRADPEIITDTIWMPSDISMGTTMVDFIGLALERCGIKYQETPAE